MTREIQDLVVLGASALIEIQSLIEDIRDMPLLWDKSPRKQYRIIAILDDDPQWEGCVIEGVPVKGPLSEVVQFPDAQFVLAIGSYANSLARYDILKRLGLPENRFETLIHPTALVHSSVSLGYGVLVFPNSLLAKGVVVKSFCQIVCAQVSFNCVIEEGALIAFGSKLAQRVHVGAYAHLGIGSIVGVPLRIGMGVQVGAGSLVIEDLAPGCVYLGNPLMLMKKQVLSPAFISEFSNVASEGC